MRILRQVNFMSGIGADRWISGGYKDAFEDLGHECFFLTFRDELGAKIKEVDPQIVMISQDRLTNHNMPAFEAARKKGIKIFVWVDSFFEGNKELKDILINRDPADIYYGETEPEWMDRFKKVTGKNYVVIPNAANKKYHFPVPPVEKYVCDVAYLGANLPLKRDAFKRLLLPLKKKYKVQIYGPGWTIQDAGLRVAASTSRALGFMKMNDMLSRKRITLPPEDENKLYSSARISLNIHEARVGSSANHVILNERTFKIPACGGFEVCDLIPGNVLRRYFKEDEMVMAEDDSDWFRKIEYYLSHESERKVMQERATARALADHTYHKRVAQILSFSNL